MFLSAYLREPMRRLSLFLAIHISGRLTPVMIFSLVGISGLAQSKPDVDQAAIELLQKNCVSCHGELRISKLDMRQRDTILKAGSRGPAVIPGEAEESLLYQAAAQKGELKMPSRTAC